MTTGASSPNFDDRHIRWQTLGDFKHLSVMVLDIDVSNNIVDFLVKFEPNEQIFVHRHLAPTNILVIDGEHVVYETAGAAVKNVRQTGKAWKTPKGDAHTEGGGRAGAIVHYSVRGETDALFEVLNDGLTTAGILRTSDFTAILKEQGPAGE